jgi:hypothetical protein
LRRALVGNRDRYFDLSSSWYFGDTEWTNNLVSFRVEERIAIGVRRPSAVCTVTGLPTS